MTARFSHSGFSDLGFSLMEMLVGISLGLVVLTMALSAWHTSQQAWQALVAQQNLQHNIRAALQALTTQAELSGAAVLMGVPNRTAVVAVRHDLGQPAVWASDNAKGGDSLQLSHSRHLDSGDCQGNRNNMGDTIRSQFQRSSSTVNDFACKDVLAAGSTYQAIAEGVEDVQVRLAERSADGQRLQWKTPSDVRDAAHRRRWPHASVGTANHAGAKP